MKKFLTQIALGTAALFSVGAANASYVMDFESGVSYAHAPSAPLLAAGDYVTQGNFFAKAEAADNSTGGLTAGMSSVAGGGCLNESCPTGSTGTFMTVVNGGIVHFGSLVDTDVSLTSLSVALAAPAPTSGTYAFAIEGDRADGSFAVSFYTLSSGFQTISTSTASTAPVSNSSSTGSLTDANITDFYVYGLYCSGSCAFSGQFAVDNITFATAAVPEPSEWLLMGLGLTAVGAAARRRRSI